MVGPKNIFIRIKGSIAAEIMAQPYFDLKRKCDELEGRTADLEAENQTLKEKVSDLAFEVMLLKEVCDYVEDEKKDEKMEQLESELADTKEELENMKTLFAAAVTRMGFEDLAENLEGVFFEDEDTKMGEDVGEDLGEEVGEEPPKKKKAVKKAGTRAYNSKRIAVTDPYLKFALNHIWQRKDLYKRNPENGHMFQGMVRRMGKYANVRFAEYYGRLNKAGDIGNLQTIILSTEGKVYQLNDNGKLAC